jgi:hypothetical protein
MLTVEEDIMDAQYFLNKLKSESIKDELRPNINAFLAISRGIIDHLLEEYNVKFGLNIPLSEKLFPNTFEKAAKDQNNTPALAFIKFYNCEIAFLKCDDVANLILNKRNIAIHRGPKQFRQEFTVHLFDTINLEETLAAKKIHKNGKIEDISLPSKSQQGKQEDKDLTRSEVESEWFFTDYDAKEGPDICQDFLNLVCGFVNKAHMQFP